MMGTLKEMLPAFAPGSPGAAAMMHLFVGVLIVCGVIFAIVATVVGICLWRFRRREGEPTSEPAQIFGNTRLEIAWTVVPLLTVVAIFVFTLTAMRAANPLADGVPDLIVRGHQWWWEVIYPKEGFSTANEIHIPAGRPLIVQLESADVIHDFWVPELGRKIDMTPGKQRRLILRADHPGNYAGACAEFCGAQHAWMRFTVTAESDAGYAAWTQQQVANAIEGSMNEVEAGRRLFNEMTCVNCHVVGAPTTNPSVAPNLSHFASRKTLGAGVLANNPANLRRWLNNPADVKPGCLMPTYHLSDDQLDALVNYLQSLH